MSEVIQLERMATVGRATLTALTTGVLLLPMMLILLLQGPSVSPAHAFPTDDFGDSIRVTFDPATSVNISSVVDSEGNVHVVWEDYRSGAGDIYYVKLDPEGNKLTNDAKITNDPTTSRHPTVAADLSDHIYVVWEDQRDSSWELYFAKLWYYNGNITFLVNGLRVSDSDPANSTEPDIEVDNEGNIAMVWTDARDEAGDGNLEIYYKRLDDDGTPITADVRVTTDVGQSEHPRLDVDSSNMVHITWYDFRDSDSGIVINHGVFYRKLWVVNGTANTIERRVTFASPSSRPDLAVDTEGNVHIVFDDDRYANFDVFYTLLDNDGVTIEDDINISPKDETESRVPRVFLSDSNAIDVAWQDQASGAWAIHYSAMAYDGTLEVYDQAVTGDDFNNATAPIVMCAKDNNTFVLFIGELDNTEMFFQRTHRPDPALFGGDILLSTSQPLVDQTMWINATVRNLEGDEVSGVVIRLLSGSETIDEAVVASIPSEGATSVSFAHVAVVGETVFTLIVDPDQAIREIDETDNQASVPVTVRIPAVEATAAETSLPAEPGATAVFDINISNDGSDEFAYQMTLSGLPDGWDADMGGTPEGYFLIPAGGMNTTQVEVTVPEGAGPSTQMFNVTIQFVERESVNRTLTFMVDVIRVGDIMVTPPAGATVEPTVTSTFVFSISNAANTNETFVVEALDELGWMLTPSATVVDLAPGESREISVEVLPARYDPPGTVNEVSLRLASQNITDNIGEGTLLCVVGDHREVVLDIVGQAYMNYSVPELRQMVYRIDVTNLGNSNDTYRMRQEGLEDFWAVLDTSYVFLDPGQTATISLYMTPGSAVLAGIYEFNVSAASESDPEISCTLMMGVSILPFYDLQAIVDYASTTVRAGSTVYLNITVENTGNSLDAFSSYVYTESFNVSSVWVNGEDIDLETDVVPSISLEPGERITLMLTIFVPEGTPEGTYSLYADFYSNSDPSMGATEYFDITVEGKGTWLTIWVIAGVAGGSGVAVLILFLFLRGRALDAQEAEEEDRRRMQQKKPAKRPAVKGT